MGGMERVIGTNCVQTELSVVRCELAASKKERAVATSSSALARRILLADAEQLRAVLQVSQVCPDTLLQA